jgi:hypothetical protein
MQYASHFAAKLLAPKTLFTKPSGRLDRDVRHVKSPLFMRIKTLFRSCSLGNFLIF